MPAGLQLSSTRSSDMKNAFLIPFAADDPSDWVIEPGNVKMALDELAQRVAPKEAHIDLVALAVEYSFS